MALTRPVARVVLTRGDEKLVAAGPGEFPIGRSVDAALRPENATISRRHAVLRVSADGVVTIKDAQSRTGTLVNGAAATGMVRLDDGDTVTLGDCAYLVTIERAP